jgi:adenylylsulfate kinase
MKILVMGLPGSGKSYLAKELQRYLKCAWYNADIVREMANDWDFSVEGRLRQATRMKTFANFEIANGRQVICDFICPTEHTRAQFDPDVIIWLDTIKESKYENTNAVFEPPLNADYIIKELMTDEEIYELSKNLRLE